MKKQLFFVLLFGLILASSGCSASKNMVTIPPYQQFILGENEPGQFKVVLTNKTDTELTVETRNEAGERTSGFGFVQYGTAQLVIPAGEMAVLQNKTGQEAILEVRLFESVEGMRYVGVENMPKAMPLTLKTDKLALLNATDWAGSLTYKDYTSDELVTIPVKMEISALDESAYEIAYIYPGEPHMNNKGTMLYDRDAGTLQGQRIIDAFESGSEYHIKTTDKGTDNGIEAVMYYTYIISNNKFVMRREVQTVGSDDVFFRNEYSLYR